MKPINTIGDLIDCTDIKGLVGMLKEMTYGNLCNLKKSLEAEYQRVEITKNELNKRLVIGSTSEEEKTKIQGMTSTLYVVLQRIEDRATLIEEVKKDKSNA